jgi:hypothetical protein
LSLVLFPLVEFLQKSGRKISAICGNLNAGACKRLRAMVPDRVAVGPQPPQVFERILRDADLLMTSPGSTTILQAMSIDLPTLLLPSQNRSQLFNAQVYAKPGADVAQWPENVLDLAELERLRSQGISALNGHIFKSMVAAANSPSLSDKVSTVIRNAVIHAPGDGVLNPRLHALGIAGADQVAELVKQVAGRRQAND